MVRPATVLANNLERVVDVVLRTMADEHAPEGGDEAVAEGDVGTAEPDATSEDQLRLQLRLQVNDLCGHVAVALRGMEHQGGPLASYVRPAEAAPKLDVRR